MNALLVIDMQVGTFDAPIPQHDADGVIARINRLAHALRRSDGCVIFVQHDGPPGDTFEPGSKGWQLVPQLVRAPEDRVVNKRACDAFYRTELKSLLDGLQIEQLLVSGSATDYCVDTTVRVAASLDYPVTVVRDGHTTADRDYLDAVSIKNHHNSVWENLILPDARVSVMATDELIDSLNSRI